MIGKLHIPRSFWRGYPPAPPTHSDGYLQPSCGYLQLPCGYPQPRCGYLQPQHGYPRLPSGYLKLPHGYPQQQCWYRLPARSERWFISSRRSNVINRTHVEYMKNPDEVLLPTRDLLLITFEEDKSEYHVPFTPLDDLPLDSPQCSAI